MARWSLAWGMKALRNPGPCTTPEAGVSSAGGVPLEVTISLNLIDIRSVGLKESEIADEIEEWSVLLKPKDIHVRSAVPTHLLVVHRRWSPRGTVSSRRINESTVREESRRYMQPDHRTHIV